jgi:hypothetical protein
MYRTTALRILNRARSMYATEHKYRAVNPNDFRHLSLGFYNDMQRSLQSLGFRQVADMEDETIKLQKPDPRTFARIMTTGDGIVNASIYHVRPTLIWRVLMFVAGMRSTKVVEFQTELENRSQVVTTTVGRRDLFPTSPKLFRNFQPRGTPVGGLYQAHRTVIDRVARDANVKPIANRTLDEILGFENRQMAIQREYLQSVGWVTRDFLLKHSGGNAEMADEIYTEIQNILEEERQVAGQK